MIYTKKIQTAIKFAIKTHQVYQKQERKGKGTPYITHPLTAGLILARAGADEDTIIAGILHDTIEDSVPEKKVTKEMLAERFGENVASLVDSVTEQDKSLSWAERKEVAHGHIASFSHDSVLVKSADVISNITDLVDDYKRDGEAIFSRFSAPREQVVGHYLEAAKALLLRWPESPLTGDLAEARIQLSRIEALASGPLAYVEWTVSFMEYEIERVFQNSKVKVQVLRLCGDIHRAVREYEVHRDRGQLDKQMLQPMSAFHKIVQDIENDEKEFGMNMLLMTHLGDIMANLKMLNEARGDVGVQSHSDLYLDEEQQKVRRIVFVNCEDEETCGFLVEFKYPNCTFFYCKEHKTGLNLDLSTISEADVVCEQHGKMERYDVLSEDNVCPRCEKMTLAILSVAR